MATIPNINLPEILSNEDLDNIINEPVVVEQAPAATPAPETAPAPTTPVPQRMSVASAYRKDAERYARQAADSYQDMLNAHREALMKERTDNAKMARFAALGNALTSMVQPLGWAIGGGGLGRGATSGYQPYDNREYISAFNRAIQAGQDLRNVNLKDAEFQYKTLQQREASARRMAEIEARTEAQLEAARIRAEAQGAKAEQDREWHLWKDYNSYWNTMNRQGKIPISYEEYVARLKKKGDSAGTSTPASETPKRTGTQTATQTATQTETKTEEKKPELGFWDRRRAAKWGKEADTDGDGRVSAAEAKAAKKKQEEAEKAKRQAAIKESSEKKTTPTQSATKATAESTARKTAVKPKDSVGTTDAAAKKWDGKKRK